MLTIYSIHSVHCAISSTNTQNHKLIFTERSPSSFRNHIERLHFDVWWKWNIFFSLLPVKTKIHRLSCLKCRSEDINFVWAWVKEPLKRSFCFKVMALKGVSSAYWNALFQFLYQTAYNRLIKWNYEGRKGKKGNKYKHFYVTI